MTTTRDGDTATLLADGRVLIAGGRDASTRFASAEPFEDGLAWVRQGDREGYVDITGTWVYSQPYVRSGKGNE